MKPKTIDLAAHLFLYFVLIIGAFAFYGQRFDSKMQFIIVLLLAFFYLIWAAVYHSLKGDLKVKLLLEYLVIASIVSLAGFLVFVI